ncbi:LytR/AlgR family response regulator transcription factor [[Clostridium] aminophilum]|uniref:Stage 0 sporulation protein A homolog n=1 Tax=[Clostridium] aminophilum TaxID=1526 RepID=A0A1I6JD29_9FIRM|nr:LytTR family DNA-binding domain-containing protein [[Clostridium] aminophilum]SFR76923.1 two component transcriptional regulator, LytTR family [[Clostridium] aminophilum]
MKIAVVDDERPARSELIWLLQQCEPDAEIQEASTADAFLKLLEEDHFDVCFVDINLNGANGTTLASMVRSKAPDTKIVFATAYREFAVKAFELGALDYVLKPFDLERIRKTMERVRNWRNPSVSANSSASGTDGNHAAETETTAGGDRGHEILAEKPDSILLTLGTGFRIVEVKDIIYIEAQNRQCLVHTKNGSFEQKETLGYYEQKLARHRFFRIHKSYMINLDRLEEMVPGYNNGYSVRMKGRDEQLPIGRTQLKDFRSLFGK